MVPNFLRFIFRAGTNQMSNTIRALISVAFALFFAAPAQALYIINIEQFGNDVTATGSGSLPTIGSFMTVLDGYTVNPGIETSDEIVIIGRPGPATSRWFFTGGVTSDFGFGAIYSQADYGFGPIVGVMAPDEDPSFLAYYVPTGYIWGSELGLSLSTWYNTTLYDMGLTPGTYSFVLGHANTEVFRVNVIGSSPVPLPPALGLFCIGLAGLGYRLRPQPRRAQ